MVMIVGPILLPSDEIVHVLQPERIEMPNVLDLGQEKDPRPKDMTWEEVIVTSRLMEMQPLDFFLYVGKYTILIGFIGYVSVTLQGMLEK
jgi:hypothetical protein